MTCTLETKGCYSNILLQWLLNKIRKMSVKGVKLKSESYFLLSPSVLEVWRKNLRGADSPPVQIGLSGKINDLQMFTGLCKSTLGKAIQYVEIIHAPRESRKGSM